MKSLSSALLFLTIQAHLICLEKADSFFLWSSALLFFKLVRQEALPEGNPGHTSCFQPSFTSYTNLIFTLDKVLDFFQCIQEETTSDVFLRAPNSSSTCIASKLTYGRKISRMEISWERKEFFSALLFWLVFSFFLPYETLSKRMEISNDCIKGCCSSADLLCWGHVLLQDVK